MVGRVIGTLVVGTVIGGGGGPGGVHAGGASSSLFKAGAENTSNSSEM